MENPPGPIRNFLVSHSYIYSFFRNKSQNSHIHFVNIIVSGASRIAKRRLSCEVSDSGFEGSSYFSALKPWLGGMVTTGASTSSTLHSIRPIGGPSMTSGIR